MDLPPESAALQILDKIIEQAPQDDARLQNYLSALRQDLIARERERIEKDQALEAYEQAYEKLTAPANKVGVFLRHLDEGQVLIALGDAEYVALVDPHVDATDLTPGRRVKLNEAFAVIGLMPSTEFGSLLKVGEALDDGRLRVGSDAPGSDGRLVERSHGLKDQPIRTGDEVRLDSSGRMAVEHFAKSEARDYFMEDVEPIPWDRIGGQEEAIRLIRETIEHPLLHPDLYKKYDKRPVKGILLYGPPGCGKTMIGKAVAYNIAKEYSERQGHEVKEYFMHISGPKILNMWLGETERMVREIFSTARERAKEGRLVVIFIDEAESILRTRSSGRWLNISNTVVPQFCAEMDGMVSLENVLLIVTSNRPDYIDPAILRPERIDRKVKIGRPDRESARAILGLYLHDNLPFDPVLLEEFEGEPACARKVLLDSTLAFLWRANRETEFLKVALRNGSTDTMHWRDLVSGALLKSIVDRAKDAAIRRAIADTGTETGITEADLHDAVRAEFRENEIFPKSDAAEDWLKLLDFDPESVASVKPVRPSKGEDLVRKNII